LRAKTCQTSYRGDGILPRRSGFGSEDPQCGARDEVALKVEGVVNRTVDAKSPLVQTGIKFAAWRSFSAGAAGLQIALERRSAPTSLKNSRLHSHQLDCGSENENVIHRHRSGANGHRKPRTSERARSETVGRQRLARYHAAERGRLCKHRLNDATLPISIRILSRWKMARPVGSRTLVPTAKHQEVGGSLQGGGPRGGAQRRDLGRGSVPPLLAFGGRIALLAARLRRARPFGIARPPPAASPYQARQAPG
jgi:hypothetical protein